MDLPPALAASLGDPALAVDLVPQSASLITTTTNLPTQIIREILLTIDPADLEQDAEADFSVQLAQILGAINDAGTPVALDAVRLESARLTAEGESWIEINLQAARGAVGSGRLIVRGLNDYLGSLVRQPSPNIVVALRIVGVMIALGESTEDETGPAHAFDVELTPTGPLLVNGQDLERLFADE